MTTWTSADLDTFGREAEITIATERPDGTSRRPLPIWVVRVGGGLYIRSYRGSGGSWFRQVNRHPYARVAVHRYELAVHLVPAGTTDRKDIDAAYTAKYGRGGPAAIMITPNTAATTLRLEPDDRS